MGAVRPPDKYDDWFPGAGAFKRAYPDDEESAFACFDAWSACSTEYQGTEDARYRFDKVARDHGGHELTVEIMYLTGKTPCIEGSQHTVPSTSGRGHSDQGRIGPCVPQAN